MNRRKEIINQYKERKLHGGIYRITNSLSGKYLVGHAMDLKSIQNRFQFAITMNSVFHVKLKRDWDEVGAQVFVFDILEEIEQKPEQNEAEFKEDLETLEQLWRANLDASMAY